VAAVAVIAGVTWNSLGPASRSRDAVTDTRVPEVELDPWERYVVTTLSREVTDAPPADGFEVASVGYDRPLFDFPLDVQEGSQPQP
jgi:hypothetical protein